MPRNFPNIFEACSAAYEFLTSTSLRARILKKGSRLKTSISLELFNLDLKNSPPKIGPWWVARLKFSIPIEIVNPEEKS